MANFHYGPWQIYYLFCHGNFMNSDQHNMTIFCENEWTGQMAVCVNFHISLVLRGMANGYLNVWLFNMISSRLFPRVLCWFWSNFWADNIAILVFFKRFVQYGGYRRPKRVTQ